MTTSLHEPRVMTVEEAAQALRIGRSTAYEAARRWLATGGAEGLPVVRLGRRLRVPCHALERMLAVEPVPLDVKGADGGP